MSRSLALLLGVAVGCRDNFSNGLTTQLLFSMELGAKVVVSKE